MSEHQHSAAAPPGPAGLTGRWWLCGYAVGDATVLELHGEFDLASPLSARGRVMAVMDAAESAVLLDLLSGHVLRLLRTTVTAVRASASSHTERTAVGGVRPPPSVGTDPHQK
ncbi:hypothetical protein [Streptomyces rimosus]|uniref:hypothetical protein n=1 Tax=Streptomyces rimosus TaxID=1927 RepID=UPI00131D1185|nr:hypothetical protein [Streptomyces rimosus]